MFPCSTKAAARRRQTAETRSVSKLAAYRSMRRSSPSIAFSAPPLYSRCPSLLLPTICRTPSKAGHLRARFQHSADDAKNRAATWPQHSFSRVRAPHDAYGTYDIPSRSMRRAAKSFAGAAALHSASCDISPFLPACPHHRKRLPTPRYRSERNAWRIRIVRRSLRVVVLRHRCSYAIRRLSFRIRASMPLTAYACQ